MTCPGTALALKAGEEAPRCPRCDRLMPEGECGCVYGVKASPYGGNELLIVTDNPAAIALLKSLDARFAPAHGWFLPSRRARMFTALADAQAQPVKRGAAWLYVMPGTAPMELYTAVCYARSTAIMEI